MASSDRPARRSADRPGTLVRRIGHAAVIAVVAFALAACGGSDDDPALPPATQPPPTQPPAPPPPQPPAVRIAIDQTGLLLPGSGQVAIVTATLFAADGTRVTGDIEWASSRPNAVAVDAGGRLVAQAASGSAQIVARSGALVSQPLVVIVASPATGAMLLTDAQIVGDPVEVDPAAPPSRNNFYRVTLAPGVALPAVGGLLGGTGSKPLAGRVVAVEPDARVVTLEPVHPRTLLPDLNVNEVIDLAQAEVTINPQVAALYDVRRDGGTFELTPRAGTASSSGLAKPQAAVGTRALTNCTSTITGRDDSQPLPVALSLPAPVRLTLPTTLEYVDTPSGGVEKLVISGTPTVKLEAAAAVTAAFEGKVECRMEIGTITIPAGGLLAWVAGGQIPYGVGIELGGKLTLATASIGGRLEVSKVVRLGFERPAGGETQFVHSMTDWTVTTSWTHDWPTVGDFRLEPSLTGYAFADFEFGSRIFRSLRVKGFTAKFGPKLAGSFAPQTTQLADATYKSNYKLSVEGSAKIGQNLSDILKLLGVASVNALDLSTSIDLSTSPIGTLTADRATFTAGDRVNLRATIDNVQFAPEVAGFGGYNVKQVLLVQQSAGTTTVVGRIDATEGQRTFDFAYDATLPGSAGEFHVFVITHLLPLDLLSLELAQATAPADPGGGGSGPVTVLPPAGDDIYGYDINASGYVVGSWQGATVGIRGFIWRGGAPTALPLHHPDDFANRARGINDRDDVVGGSGSKAVLWPGGGSPIDLNARVAGTGWTLQEAIDINNKGQIVGIGTKDGASAIFFLDSDGSVSKVIDRSSPSSLYEVAEDGAVVGDYDFQSGIGRRSYLWRKGEDLIVIEGSAMGLSGAGAVVGSVRAGLSFNRGVRWHPPFGQSDFTEIQPADPAHLVWPQDISAGGGVVGFFSGTAPDGNGFSKAFHARAGVFTDLTALHGGDAIQQNAVRISETGRILVQSYRRDSSGTPQQYFQVVPAP